MVPAIAAVFFFGWPAFLPARPLRCRSLVEDLEKRRPLVEVSEFVGRDGRESFGQPVHELPGVLGLKALHVCQPWRRGSWGRHSGRPAPSSPRWRALRPSRTGSSAQRSAGADLVARWPKSPGRRPGPRRPGVRGARPAPTDELDGCQQSPIIGQDLPQRYRGKCSLEVADQGGLRQISASELVSLPAPWRMILWLAEINLVGGSWRNPQSPPILRAWRHTSGASRVH
jgi:hypothetical protein